MGGKWIDSVDVYFSEDSLESQEFIGRFHYLKDSVHYSIVKEFNHSYGVVKARAVGLDISDTSDFFKLNQVNGISSMFG